MATLAAHDIPHGLDHFDALAFFIPKVLPHLTALELVEVLELYEDESNDDGALTTLLESPEMAEAFGEREVNLLDTFKETALQR